MDGTSWAISAPVFRALVAVASESACSPVSGGTFQRMAAIARTTEADNAAQAKKDSLEHAIYAASFKKTGKHFPLVWAANNKDVPAENVTDRYSKKTSATVPDTGKSAAALKALRELTETTRSAEVRKRANDLIARIDLEWPTLSPRELREFRAVEVLEWIGTDEAKSLLAALANGEPSAPVTSAALSGAWTQSSKGSRFPIAVPRSGAISSSRRPIIRRA